MIGNLKSQPEPPKNDGTKGEVEKNGKVYISIKTMLVRMAENVSFQMNGRALKLSMHPMKTIRRSLALINKVV